MPASARWVGCSPGLSILSKSALVSGFEIYANSLSYYPGLLKCHSKKYALFSSTDLALNMQDSGRRTIKGFSMRSDGRERRDQRGLRHRKDRIIGPLSYVLYSAEPKSMSSLRLGVKP